MIEIVFTACLLTAPETCRDRHLTFAEPLSPMACLTGAQPELARWGEAHPEWRVARWRCQRVRTAAREA